MKKVLSLFTLCAIFAFAGCNKNKEEKHKSAPKKEHVKKEKCSKCSKDKKNCVCKKADKKMKKESHHVHKHHSAQEAK